MRRALKVELAFMGVMWAGLAGALAGALSTPRDHCSEYGGMPPGELAVIVGLTVATVAFLVPVTIESLRESTWRSTLICLALTLLALAAGIAIAYAEADRVASWGCG